MVARAWAERADSKKSRPEASSVTKGKLEERFVQNDAVSLCLLINRRTKTMRVIDFRAGPSHAKRIFVLNLAEKEGIEKVYTLVERDEVSTWLKLGFAREASIPGFYKRSDAYLLGTVVADALAGPLGPIADLDDDDDALDAAPSPELDRMEKTLVAAKKQVKPLLDRQLPPTKLTPVSAAEAQKAVDKALRAGRALTAFESFGRDVERRYFRLTARGGFDLVASVEAQSCFGNAFLELLTAPTTDAERQATVSALCTLCDSLVAEGVGCCFALGPSDDIALSTAFLCNGFRRTGLLAGHIRVGHQRKDAIVWSRKLAGPTDA